MWFCIPSTLSDTSPGACSSSHEPRKLCVHGSLVLPVTVAVWRKAMTRRILGGKPATFGRAGESTGHAVGKIVRPMSEVLACMCYQPFLVAFCLVVLPNGRLLLATTFNKAADVTDVRN